MDIVQKEYEQVRNYDNLEELENEESVTLSPFGQFIQEFLDENGQIHKDQDAEAGKNICKYLQEQN